MSAPPLETSPCPCGSTSYDACCGRLHRGEEQAATYSDPSVTWTGLEILDAIEDTVEFRAHHSGGTLHERSRFEQRAGRWFYVGGDVE